MNNLLKGFWKSPPLSQSVVSTLEIDCLHFLIIMGEGARARGVGGKNPPSKSWGPLVRWPYKYRCHCSNWTDTSVCRLGHTDQGIGSQPLWPFPNDGCQFCLPVGSGHWQGWMSGASSHGTGQSAQSRPEGSCAPQLSVTSGSAVLSRTAECEPSLSVTIAPACSPCLCLPDISWPSFVLCWISTTAFFSTPPPGPGPVTQAWIRDHLLHCLAGVQREDLRAQTLALPLISCMTLRKFLGFSVPPFPYL